MIVAASDPPDPGKRAELEELELDLFLDGVFRSYGFDFRNYARASVRRRLRLAQRNEGAPTITAYLDRVLHDPAVMQRFLATMSVHVTAMFRDPGFYVTMREKVIPLLRTYPFVRIWHAGCSTGQEVYSMAILLLEENLYGRCRIYATDLNTQVLEAAESGIFPLSSMQRYTSNYLKAGGRRSFSEYYTARYDNVILDAALRKNIIFSQHNLVSDGSFNEFNLILCRNVLIYFNETLQAQVHKLLYASLGMFGVLGLGNRESIRFSPVEKSYEELDADAKLYRKVA